jgi:DNA ligase-associated metallophosphoesterase
MQACDEQTMNALEFQFQNQTVSALSSGALFWPSENLLVVSDLHLGKSARVARFGGAQLPPYETTETLTRLADDLTATGARRVICLGDSFDAPNAQDHLPDADLLSLTTLQAGLEWVWIEGNHDPGPVDLGGRHMRELTVGPLRFRHIAENAPAPGEVSGHYHPKATLPLRGRTLTRPCFLFDETRLILPAYGAFTGGLRSDAPILRHLMTPRAQAILTGGRLCVIPMPGLASGA